MKKRIKKKWVKALRSGEYEQGTYQLRDSDNYFCCLGVLCDIYAKENNKRWRQGCFAGNDALLPDSVIEWSGLLDEFGGKVVINEQSKCLTAHNDHGKTFTEIADAIQAQL